MVKVVKDCWMVGDAFLYDIFDTMQRMKEDGKDKAQLMPYIYDFYNVSFIMETLNEETSLPRFILVIPDWDILKYIDHFTFGISLIAGKCLNWIINNMERAIEAKKEDLRRRKPGAVSPNEPKIVWVKMVGRFSDPNRAGIPILAVHNKFNCALEELLANRRCHYILDAGAALADASCFTYNGQLTARRKGKFWEEVDCQIEKFDYQKITLLPTATQKPKQIAAPESATEWVFPVNKVKNRYNFTFKQ